MQVPVDAPPSQAGLSAFVALLAMACGLALVRAENAAMVAPVLGAGITTYAAASGALGSAGSEDDPSASPRDGVLHGVGSFLAGTIGLLVGVLAGRSLG